MIMYSHKPKKLLVPVKIVNYSLPSKGGDVFEDGMFWLKKPADSEYTFPFQWRLNQGRRS